MQSLWCQRPDRRFVAMGVAFVLLGLQAPGFLPAGIAFLVLAGYHRMRRKPTR